MPDLPVVIADTSAVYRLFTPKDPHQPTGRLLRERVTSWCRPWC